MIELPKVSLKYSMSEEPAMNINNIREIFTNPNIKRIEDEEREKFDFQKYFFIFMQTIFTILLAQGASISSILNLSMDPLSVKYEPCQRCMITDNKRPQTKRCRHRKGCSHEDCDCRVFTSPCLTHSKVGLCLHLQWSQFNINMDVDFSPPSLPTSNMDQYDGKIDDKRAFLERMKFVGWLEEWKKSVSMAEARAFPESKRSIR